MGNLASLGSSSPWNSAVVPGVDDDEMEEKDRGHDITMILLSLARSGKLVDPDLLCLIFEYLGVSFRRKCERRGWRRGQNNENRNDITFSLFKERAEHDDTLASLGICAQCDLVSVTYEVASHDQGWSSDPNPRETHGTRTSHTWGEAKVNMKRLGDSGDEEQVDEFSRYHIYRNLHASSKWETHNYVFGKGTAFMRTIETALNEVRQQRAGDVSMLLNHESDDENQDRNTSTILELSVQLWIRSQYPAWRNEVNFSSITTEWKIRKQYLRGLINTYAPRNNV